MHGFHCPIHSESALWKREGERTERVKDPNADLLSFELNSRFQPFNKITNYESSFHTLSASIESTTIESQRIKTAIHYLARLFSIFARCDCVYKCEMWMNGPTRLCTHRLPMGSKYSRERVPTFIFYNSVNFLFVVCRQTDTIHLQSRSRLIFIFPIFASHSSRMPILILPPSNVIGAIKDKVQVKLCRRQGPVCHCFFIHSPFDLCLVFQLAFKIEFETEHMQRQTNRTKVFDFTIFGHGQCGLQCTSWKATQNSWTK